MKRNEGKKLLVSNDENYICEMLTGNRYLEHK
jgi:hypothetical protein